MRVARGAALLDLASNVGQSGVAAASAVDDPTAWNITVAAGIATLTLFGIAYKKIAPKRIAFGSQRGASFLRTRADDLFNVTPKARGDTVAVIKGRNRVTGEERVFVAKQGKQKNMPERWQGKLQKGEQWVPGVDRNFHAEENILRNPELKDWDFIEGGTSRNVCSPSDRCGRAIQDAGMQLGGPDFPGNQETTSRMFWRQEEL